MVMFCPTEDQHFQYFKKEIEKNNEILERKPLFIYNPETKMDAFNKNNHKDICLSVLMEQFQKMPNEKHVTLLKDNVNGILIYGYKRQTVAKVTIINLEICEYDDCFNKLITTESYTFMHQNIETINRFVHTKHDTNEEKDGTYYDLYRLLKYFNLTF